jgi:hypothetical protein
MRPIIAFALAMLVCSVNAKGAYEASDKDFNSKVLESGKNVFVKFLAPW